jgi:hypothetical protein
LRIGNSKNRWNLWCYPPETLESPAGLLITPDLDAACTALRDGKRVLLLANGATGQYVS